VKENMPVEKFHTKVIFQVSLKRDRHHLRLPSLDREFKMRLVPQARKAFAITLKEICEE
jgi:hypothetical protein